MEIIQKPNLHAIDCMLDDLLEFPTKECSVHSRQSPATENKTLVICAPAPVLIYVHIYMLYNMRQFVSATESATQTTLNVWCVCVCFLLWVGRAAIYIFAAYSQNTAAATAATHTKKSCGARVCFVYPSVCFKDLCKMLGSAFTHTHKHNSTRIRSHTLSINFYEH